MQNVYKITRLGVGKEMQEETAKRVGHLKKNMFQLQHHRCKPDTSCLAQAHVPIYRRSDHRVVTGPSLGHGFRSASREGRDFQRYYVEISSLQNNKSYIELSLFFQPLHSIHTTTIFDHVELAQGSMLLVEALLGGPGCLN